MWRPEVVLWVRLRDQRDDWLVAQGIATMRIPAREVLADPAAVADAILRTVMSRVQTKR